MTSDTVTQLQITQQNLHSIIMQKQQIESQLTEVESALQEIAIDKELFKIMGKIMVAVSTDSLKKELQQKIDLLTVRLKNFTKQEETLNKTVEELQRVVITKFKKNE